KGGAAAASSSQRKGGKVSRALQLEFPTPQAQLLASLPRWTTLGSVESENHSMKTRSTSNAAAAIPRISDRSSFEASISPRSADNLSIGATLSQPDARVVR